jgi:hypothetical protein
MVVFAAQMGEHYITRVAVVIFPEKAGHLIVREVAYLAHNALLQLPGVGARFETVEVVIRFEHEGIATSQRFGDRLRYMAQIRYYRYLDPFRFDREDKRIDSESISNGTPD